VPVGPDLGQCVRKDDRWNCFACDGFKLGGLGAGRVMRYVEEIFDGISVWNLLLFGKRDEVVREVLVLKFSRPQRLKLGHFEESPLQDFPLSGSESLLYRLLLMGDELASRGSQKPLVRSGYLKDDGLCLLVRVFMSVTCGLKQGYAL
jgi:hypothetical protein